MVLENLLEIINEINRSEISLANRKKAQPLSLIELEHHPDAEREGFEPSVPY